MIDFEKLANLNINFLFFDYNSLIHPCAQQILSANHDKYILIENIDDRTNIIERDIIQNCLNYTRLLINQVLNTKQRGQIKNVYITIDGVAPRSKMNQQRERRYKSEFFKAGESNKSSLWDSNKITPGTTFMKKIRESLDKFKTELTDIDCVISDSNDIGEGEHKIMKIISGLSSNARVCIYGLDADLIMLSLMNCNYDKIILIRDNSFNNNLSEAKKVIDYLNINHLRRYICNDMLELLEKHKGVKPNSIDLHNLVYDYVLMCFLLGNDFLEHIPSLSIKKHGIDIIMRAYINSWKGFHLINKEHIHNLPYIINLHYLKDIMYNLKNSEIYFFNNFKLDSLALNEHANYEILEQKDNVSFYKDDFIKFTEENYKSRYYMYYDIKNEDINNACLNYIEGLYWIFGYYIGHIHNNWTWYYRYNNVPFCSDIFEFLRKTQFNSIIAYVKKSEYLKPSQVYSPIKQLFMVLPKSSLIRILKEMNYPVENLEHTLFLYDKFYPTKICVDLYNKKYLWQSKVFFENIDEKILELFLE
jgi:5'-3' exoribonuclease 1